MSEIIWGCCIMIVIGISFFSGGNNAAGITCVAGGAFIIGCLLVAAAISERNGEEE